ncbi:hypothetical protein [Cupriavidus sp. CuC1]|uniref:hypothetical protein n=1 Tax=Cupriavidus sp. CuC1 TaxID=3373131 RepID=UPI0037D6BA9E
MLLAFRQSANHGKAAAALPLERVLYGRSQIIGTVKRSRAQSAKYAMVRRLSERRLDHFTPDGLTSVVCSVFPPSNAADAHRRMESNRSVGRIVLTTSGTWHELSCSRVATPGILDGNRHKRDVVEFPANKLRPLTFVTVPALRRFT